MTKALKAATVGNIARERRTAAGLTQTELAQRIGASRFWVAEFERGKPTVELGLALRALHALGLTVAVAPSRRAAEQRHTPAGNAGLAAVIARTTLPGSAPSSVEGWPTAAPAASPSRPSRRPRKR